MAALRGGMSRVEVMDVLVLAGWIEIFRVVIKRPPYHATQNYFHNQSKQKHPWEMFCRLRL